MKILLTGSEGQLGRSLQTVFAGDAWDLIPCGRAQFNVTDTVSVARTIERLHPDVIINAAAYTAVDKAESEPELAAQINTLGPALLASAASKVDAALIHISTDYVFDGGKAGAYTEEDSPSPQNIYGLTKYKGEVEVLQRCSRSTVLRTSWVFSEYGQNFLKTMLRLAGERPQLSIVNDQLGCPTYAGDIALACRAICEALAQQKSPYGIYHYAGNEAVSWYGFAEAIFECAQETGLLKAIPALTGITTAEFPTAAARPMNSVLDSSKIKSELKVPASQWRAAIAEVVERLGRQKSE